MTSPSRSSLTPETISMSNWTSLAFSWGDKVDTRQHFHRRGRPIAYESSYANSSLKTGLPTPPIGCPSSRALRPGHGTGSGKSTTLASIVIQSMEPACHILTIEDPVEYVHNHKTSAVNQREVGLDSLRSTELCDRPPRGPRCLLIGEMRDIDSIRSP